MRARILAKSSGRMRPATTSAHAVFASVRGIIVSSCASATSSRAEKSSGAGRPMLAYAVASPASPTSLNSPMRLVASLAMASKSSGESWRQAAKAQLRLASACGLNCGREASTCGTSASNSSAWWCSSRACAQAVLERACGVKCASLRTLTRLRAVSSCGRSRMSKRAIAHSRWLMSSGARCTSPRRCTASSTAAYMCGAGNASFAYAQATLARVWEGSSSAWSTTA
mmetsp:Transcript_24993/g.54402  ORF Transcript_24993/g.54402 Transcript_24993/m.54402 type:complete len:227 (+) Transcript_24993:613-1293(+)